ncbi:MAG TPA: carbohydrate ABC transporter permease [Microbacterium sp.]|uniref:carbohydrate ABC transporter permease n=1 Tax=Microbacterium sp. TaxID=51671 RepID=UPI002B6C3A30|nr:carbohydrate ABC transporter permease [Microbacterium sp.]HWI30209.1 carbohydrate ABC transporter permease [Microbacterium sp.]
MNTYRPRTFVREALVFAAIILAMIPFYFLVNMSFKSNGDALVSSPAAFPSPPTLDSFITAFVGSETRSIPLGALNSTIITAGTLILLVVFGSSAAYILHRVTNGFTRIAYWGFVAAVILPTQLGVVPTYVALRNVGLVGTHLGMILLYAGLLMPLSVFLYSGFVRTVPRDYEEAAQLDGAGPVQMFVKVVFPLLAPATGTVAIMSGLIVWNDFFNALIFLSGTETATLPLVVYGFVGDQVSRWNVIFAGVILSMIPALVFYLVAQKRFMQGFAGGIKS